MKVIKEAKLVDKNRWRSQDTLNWPITIDRGSKTAHIYRQKMMGVLRPLKLVDKNDGRPKTSQICRQKVMGFL